MSASWKREIQNELGAGPNWTDDHVPLCSESCAQYDGKRCRLLGARPSSTCEPVVALMAERLNATRPKDAP